MSDRDATVARADATPHRLGEFNVAKSLSFIVYGDDEHDPIAVRVMLDDGIQAPYQILAVEGVGCYYPSPEVSWLKGWIDSGDPWARVIYGNTIGVVRQARARGQNRPS
ncbi:hypothetical protein L0U85_18430 [Glycomyces sp. L485]|uniref:hypothetical protein n=1 Tax=Glycomyces sp. L485 TaxID=2909235 RepID=UPI001F4B3E76|nr:hypothetical protein [Glycomyces sp. L485]MCH7232814.1 hypothetical protein [Glycomyces sp. L485]